MKHSHLIVGFVLSLSVVAKTIPVLDPGLLRRLAARQDTVEGSNAKSILEVNSYRWPDLPEIESKEDVKLSQEDDSYTSSIADDAVSIRSIALSKRMESDPEETATPKSTLSPNAPEFVPQSRQNASPQQPQAGSVRSPQASSPLAGPVAPSRSSPTFRSTSLTPDHQALLEHIKAVSTHQKHRSEQFPLGNLNPSSSPQSPTLSPSQQNLLDQSRSINPSQTSLRIPSTAHPHLASLDRIKDVAFREPEPSFGHYLRQQPPSNNQPLVGYGDTKDSRFFPGGRSIFQTPRSPLRIPKDTLFDRPGPALKIKVPPPEIHPEASPPSLPPPRSPSQPTPFRIPSQEAMYHGPSPHLMPIPSPMYNLALSPAWYQPPQFQSPPFHNGGSPQPIQPINIPPARSRPGWPYPTYIGPSPPRNVPHWQALPGSPSTIRPGGSSPPSPQGTHRSNYFHEQRLLRASPEQGLSRPFRSVSRPAFSPQNQPRVFRQSGFQPQSLPRQIQSPRGPPPGLTPSPGNSPSPVSPVQNQPRPPTSVIVTPFSQNKNGQNSQRKP